MKKRLLCLVVALLLALPTVLSGCSGGSGGIEKPKLQTITLAMIKGEKTTDAGIEAVERALNRIIEGAYNVHVDLQAYAEDEYYEIIETKLENHAKELEEQKAAEEAAKKLAEELKKKGITTLPETTVEETTAVLETYLDEDGNPVYIYPDAEENQVDIFLLTDIAKYHKLVADGLLYEMTETLTEGHKNLNKQIHPALMSAVTIDGMVYGIPNNHVLGEKTYLLLNKEICTEQLHWAGTEFTSLGGLKKYLQAVATYCPDVTPLYNLPEDYVAHLTDGFSLLGYYYPPGFSADSQPLGCVPSNVLQNGTFTNYLLNCSTYRTEGWVVESDEVHALPTDGTYAAAFLKGGQNIVDTYSEDYYVIEYGNPVVSNRELFAGVYAITSYSKAPAVCMDIIAMLTSDAEVRNLLQYGAENVTYTVDEETGMIVPNTEGEYIWDPNPVHTGNQFILKQSSLMTEHEILMSNDDWNYAKTCNLQVTLDPYCNFPVKKIDKELLTYRYENQIFVEGGVNVEYDEEGNPTMTLEEYIAKYEETYTYTDVMYEEIEKFSADVMDRIKNFKEYVDPETQETVTFQAFLTQIKKETNKYLTEASSSVNPDSPLAQYARFRENGNMVLDWE